MNNDVEPAASAGDPPAREVAWRPYGPEAFALAKKLNRPVVVDVGAVWCHWCHVMDRTTYENPEAVGLINARFVAVRVDRDRRPALDRRLQQQVSAYQLRVNGRASGGWPLTAFLSPDGWLLHGETYMPADRFIQVAAAVADFYEANHETVRTRAAAMAKLMADRRAQIRPAAATVSTGVTDTVIADLRKTFDERHGGFGGAPKFPAPPSTALLIRAARDRGDERLLGMALKTLTAMARGGIRDHVGGGFHRYSVDERWVVPHFEKLLDVNAGLLDNDLDLAQAVDSPLAREAAGETIRFLDEVLSDRDRGGFFGSQDADVGLHDDGAAFTWSLADFRAAVPDDVEALAVSYFGVAEVGEMEAVEDGARAPTEQNVLHATKTIEELAALNDLTPEAARTAIGKALEALRAARAKRPAPAVDRSIYIDWNAATVSAYLKASVVLGRADCRAFAVRTIERIMKEAYDPKRGVAHVIPPSGEPTAYGHLADNAGFADALLDAYEVTGERRYLGAARTLMDLVVATLWDERGGGFFDVVPAEDDAVLNQSHKDIQDRSLRSGNAVAADVLIRLAQLTGAGAYRNRAEQALASFGDLPKELGAFGAGLAMAIDRFHGGPAHLVVIGDPEDERTSALHEAALTTVVSRRAVQRIDPARDADLLATLGYRAMKAPVLLVCGRDFCLEPVTDAADLPARVAELTARSQ